MTSDLRRLTLRVVVPAPAPRGAVEVRPLADGQDILAHAFDKGPGEDPRYLLSPEGPLDAAEIPHEVRLAEAPCTEECCGALYVTIRRDRGHVVWNQWRNPDRDDVVLPEIRFDAEQYQTEVERATADRSWEWPARTVARLLEEHLGSRADWLARWECELGGVSAWLWEPDQINLFFFHPGRSSIGADRPWLQFRMSLAVSKGNPALQAQVHAEHLLSGDPREVAEVCGGSAEFAMQLGYPWPQRRRT